MKYAAMSARILLGLIFVVFSLNFWLHFIPMPDMPEDSPAGTFMGVIFASGYLTFVKLLELLGGILLISGRFVNLGLVLIGPVLVNILLFHFLLAKADYALPVAMGVLALVALISRREFTSALLAK